jgi:hypothetical protein
VPTTSSIPQTQDRPLTQQSSSTVNAVTPTSQCVLQIRLPSGKTLKADFQSNDTLSSVYKYAANHLDPGTDFIFIIPFPRKEFTEAMMKLTLKEAGLYFCTHLTNFKSSTQTFFLSLSLFLSFFLFLSLSLSLLKIWSHVEH